MIDFIVNQQKCIKCGKCVADCPARIISMEESFPYITQEKEASCYKCQHCLSICPTGSVSILGLSPENSLPLTDNLPDAAQMELLIKGRRAVRKYKPENLEQEVLQRLLDVACYAPSGMNARQVRFTVVDDRDTLAKLLEDMMTDLGQMVSENRLPVGMEFLAGFIAEWQESKIDFLFRGAPHLLVVSAPENIVTPVPDCLIAMTTFEFFAQCVGVGTVWDGFAKLVINDLLPAYRSRLGIPDDHVVGYAMAFGKPAVQYARTAQHVPAHVHRVN